VTPSITTAPPRTTTAATVTPSGLPAVHGRQGGYLAKMCPERVAKDNMPLTYPVTWQDPTSAFTEQLFANGNNFEDHIGARLAAEAAPGTVAMIVETRAGNGDRTVEGKTRKEADTFAAYLDPAVMLIFNARLGSTFEALLSQHLGTAVADTDRISEPDAIVLGGVLANGLRAMHFVDVKWHKMTSGASVKTTSYASSALSGPFLPTTGALDLSGTLHSEDWKQLAHYYRHGQTLGVVAPEAADGTLVAVIGKEELLIWAELTQLRFSTPDLDTGKSVRMSPLAIYDRDFARGLAVVDNALARDANPRLLPLVFPEWKDDCGQCPWKSVCLAELTAAGDGGHVTLLAGVTLAKARALYRSGIRDVGDLARHSVLDPIPGVPDTEKIVYQARVTAAGTVHRAPGVTAVDLPRASIEIDFDAEADGGLTYMWGVRTIHRHTSRGVRRERVQLRTFDDYSGSSEGEYDVFRACWEYFQQQVATARARHYSIRFYHYSGYERTAMKNLAELYAGRPGIPSVDTVLTFFDTACVDMYTVLKRDLVWPTKSHSIKALAAHTGFAWADETPGGDNSMLWYRTGCSDPDPSVRAANIARLRQYNADDVAAQTHLRAWVSTRQTAADPADRLPAVESLTRPPFPETALAS
jgi:predicted RecB family nuclease